MTQNQQQTESCQATDINAAPQAFIVYVRTLQFLKTRLKGIDENSTVHIPQSEIAQRFFPFSKYNCKNELQKLIEANQLQLTESINQKSGHKMYHYAAMQPGPVDMYLVRPKATILDSDLHQMMMNLQNVTIDPSVPELPAYFESFLNFKNDCMNLFFTVDDFSGRVHTPVTSLKGSIRSQLLLFGQPTVGMDVVTMQPLLLGKILKGKIGSNEYSNWIESGEDIYAMLQIKAKLQTREQGKKRFFEILFAPANNKLSQMFGDSEWIAWINWYKNQPEPKNPHHAIKPHSNLAWLLQSTEVGLMRKVWEELIIYKIPFLSVHDEIIVKESDLYVAESIFRSVLKQEFTAFKLSIKKNKTISIPPPSNQAGIKHIYIGSDGLLYNHIPDLPNLK